MLFIFVSLLLINTIVSFSQNGHNDIYRGIFDSVLNKSATSSLVKA